MGGSCISWQNSIYFSLDTTWFSLTKETKDLQVCLPTQKQHRHRTLKGHRKNCPSGCKQHTIDLLDFSLIISKVFQDCLLQGQSISSCFLSEAMGERKSTHWSKTILSSLCHVSFWCFMSFVSITHQISASRSLSLVERIKTILQRHLPEANHFLETGRDRLQKHFKGLGGIPIDLAVEMTLQRMCKQVHMTSSCSQVNVDSDHQDLVPPWCLEMG